MPSPRSPSLSFLSLSGPPATRICMVKLNSCRSSALCNTLALIKFCRMKCQEVGAEGLCSDAIAGGCLWEAALIPEQEKPGHLWHCWKVNQSLGSLLLCWFLQGAQLTLKPMPTPAVCVTQAGAPSANSPGVQRDFQTANATHLYKLPLYPPLGSVFQFTEHQLISPSSGAAFRKAQ